MNGNVKTENYPTQNINPQTLAITGVSADCLYCEKECAVGLNPHLHALVAERHYHDAAALLTGSEPILFSVRQSFSPHLPASPRRTRHCWRR